MELDATTAFPNPAPERAAPSSRALFVGRRALGWLVDGFLLGVVFSVEWFALSLVGMVFVGAAVGATGGGLDGLAVAGATGFAAIAFLVIAANVAALATLLAYYRWAARRTGVNAGQTLGHQLVGVRVVREGTGEPVSGRRMLGRELARYLWLGGIGVAALIIIALTNSAALGNLVMFGGIAVVIWRSSSDRFPHDRMAGTRVAEATR